MSSDSFVGEGLNPTPYREEKTKADLLLEELWDARAEIARLKAGGCAHDQLVQRVLRAEAELKMAREEHYFQSCLTRDLLPYQERAERAEAENERLRALLDMARREQCQCRTCRAIRAALALGEKL